MVTLRFYKWLAVGFALTVVAAPAHGDSDVTGSVFAATPSATVVGKVVDAATGKPLAAAQVAPVGDLGAVTQSDEKGRFTLVAPADAGSTYEVYAAGYLPRRVVVRRSEIASGRIPAVGLEPAARLSGRILSADGRPADGVAIEAVPASMLADRPFSPAEPVVDRAASDHEGRFELAGLSPASAYELRALKAGHLPAAMAVVTAPWRGQPPFVRIELQPARAAVGRAVDEEGRPLAGVRIALRPSRRQDRPPPKREADSLTPDDAPAVAESDREGRFRVERCPAAEVDVEARLEGYAPVRRFGFRVGPEASPLDLGALVLRPGARLAGRVVDGRGQGVAGAQVYIFDRLPSAAALDDEVRGRKPDATTAGDGGFAFADLPAGVALHLAVNAESYLPATVRGVRPPTGAPLLIRLESGFQVTGRVVDEQNQPVPGAAVGLSSRQVVEGDPYRRPLGRRVSRRAVTDTDGRFVIRGALAGPATLSAAAEGFVPIEGIDLEVPPRDPRQELVVRLRLGAVVWGWVVTTAGDPVAGARILAAGRAGASDAEGAYRFSGVAEGKRRIEVTHPSYRLASRTVAIVAGENRVDFELPAGVAVEGRVVDAGGDPVAGADVRLAPEQPHDSGSYQSRSDAEGAFRLEPVATGRYRLLATAADGSSGEAPLAVEVGREPLAGLEVALEPGAVLVGRILGLAPDELAGVAVEARRDARTLAGRLDAGGAYQVGPLTPGAWLVRASSGQGQKEARARVVVTPEVRELSRDLEFGRGLTLSGVVLFEEQPLPDALLTVRGERFAIERTVLTGFDGGFRLEELEPDLYRLGISKPDQLLAHNQWLELAEHREMVIRLVGATVAGTVRDGENGAMIAGALVRLLPTEGPKFMILDSSQGDGTFHLLRVPPGTHRVVVSADGFVGAEETVRVTASEPLSGLDFALRPTAGGMLQVALAAGGVPQLVHLLVVDEAGAPVVAESRPLDAAGRVRLATLPPGTWQAFVSAPAAATTRRTLAVPGEPVAVTLPPAGRLSLRVAALAETDLLASVTLFGPDQQPLWNLGPGGSLQNRWPMVAGQATVEGVPTGTWLVRVESADGRVWDGSAVTTGDGETSVALE